MNRVQLFINNKEIELNQSVIFSITRQFEDITNPTIIINDWSKTVEIPFTNRNNQIFGHIYCPDKVIVDGDEGADKVGVYFNPYLKLDMRLMYNGMPLMTGYAKMNSIKNSNGKGTYNITLCGELGKLFQEMRKITFDATAYPEGTGSTYYIDGSKYVEEYMNQDIIARSWTYGEQLTDVLVEKGQPNYEVTDIVGWAPNNAYNNGYDEKTFQVGEYSAKTFADVIDETYERNNKAMDGDTLIGDGLLPREIGEYRSYHQLPFVYFNKLFQMFQKKAEELTGYEFELDDEWFNPANAYWYREVMMLKKFDEDKNTTSQNAYPLTLGNLEWTTTYTGQTSSIKYNVHKNANLNCTRTGSSEQTAIYDFDNQRYVLEQTQNGSITNNMNPLTWKIAFSDGGWENYLYFGEKNALIINLKITGANGHVANKKVLVCDVDTNLNSTTYFPGFNENDYALIIRVPSDPDSHTTNRVNWNISFELNSFMDYYTFGSYAKYSIDAIWYNDEAVLKHMATDFRSGVVTMTFGSGLYSVVTKNTYAYRSNSYFTFNDLWNNDFNLFDIILNYCKMHRILVMVDDMRKKVIFIPAATYFKDYTIEDWSDKVDFGRDFTIKPLTFENKYVLFNYEDDDTKMDKNYVEKYGQKFGEKKIITEYNFNDETIELFTGITPSFVNTDNVLSWTNIYDNLDIKYSFPAEVYVYSKGSDKKYQDNFGALFFHCGLSQWDTEAKLHMRTTWISDDTDYQTSTNTYFYTQLNKYMTHTDTYPHLDVVFGDNMCIFQRPAECWTYNNNYSTKDGIYYNFWQQYINERYNVQNKILTCYINISPIDYYNFKFNKFVKIENQLYFVNKIYDYDMSSIAPTKVDLITIQDIAGYTENNYHGEYIIASEHQLTIPYDYYKKITIKSSGNWEIRSGDWTDFLTAIPTTGGAGETEVIIGSIDETVGGTLQFDLYSDDDEYIASTSVVCGVGGSSTLHVSQWYNEITVGNSTTVNITSNSPWHVMDEISGGNADVTLTPKVGGVGLTNVLIRSNSGTGVNDYYLENRSGDIVSFRINVVNS